MFRVSEHPSSGALKTVTATSGIGHNTGTATSFQRGLIRKKKELCCKVHCIGLQSTQQSDQPSDQIFSQISRIGL